MYTCRKMVKQLVGNIWRHYIYWNQKLMNLGFVCVLNSVVNTYGSLHTPIWRSIWQHRLDIPILILLHSLIIITLSNRYSATLIIWTSVNWYLDYPDFTENFWTIITVTRMRIRKPHPFILPQVCMRRARIISARARAHMHTLVLSGSRSLQPRNTQSHGFISEHWSWKDD